MHPDEAVRASRWTRRRAITAGAASLWATAVLRAAPALAAGYGSSGATTSTPTKTGGGLTLVAAISYQGGANFSGVQQQLVNEYITARFQAKHPGVKVTTIAGPSSNGNSSSTTGLIAAAVAGAGPDFM